MPEELVMRNGALIETNLLGLGQPRRGKVRDIYDLGDYLLVIATDRISVFDVVLPDGIPKKGNVLNTTAALWFIKLREIIPNHLATISPANYPKKCRRYVDALLGRSMLVEKAQTLPVECVVRGYLYGSAIEEYREKGSVSGILLPAGLREADMLPQNIFTPATKAEYGKHDENIDFDQMVKKVGLHLACAMKAASLELYRVAGGLAAQAGILIADTKFEFGLDNKGCLLLIDEALTPDSSRFWPAVDYRPGGPQKSFDKQFVRDYVTSLRWNKKSPGPELPEEVIRKTTEKYVEAFNRLNQVLMHQ